MKQAKRFLSVLLSVVLLSSALFGFGVTAQAANSNTVSITVSGKEYNSDAKTAVANINTARKQNGLSPITISQKLTKVAKLRAKQEMLYYSNEVLPDGRETASAYLSGYTYEVYCNYYASKPDAATIENYINGLKYSSYSDVKTIGIGVFAMKNYFGNWRWTLYVLISPDGTTAAQTDFTNKDVSTKIAVKKSLFTVQIDGGDVDEKRAKQEFTLIGDAKYGVVLYFDATNQFTVTSSNTNVIKPKKSYLYYKGNGKYTLYAQSKNTKSYKVKLASGTLDAVSTKKHKMKLKSPAKKQLKVTWTPMFNDITGYQIQYSTSKKFTKKSTKSIIVKGKSKKSKTIKKLKSKKTYYVRIRAYVDQGSNEKLYTKWSKTAKIKVK